MADQQPLTPKTCKTCAHRNGLPGSFASCAYTGNYAHLSRQYGTCPSDFSAWQPRQGIAIRIWQVIAGCKSTNNESKSA